MFLLFSQIDTYMYCFYYWLFGILLGAHTVLCVVLLYVPLLGEPSLLLSWSVSHLIMKVLAFLSMRVYHVIPLVPLWTLLMVPHPYLGGKCRKELFSTFFSLTSHECECSLSHLFVNQM